MMNNNDEETKGKIIGTGLAFPASLLILVILFVPILLLVRYSFNEYDPVDLMISAFTLENYKVFFADEYYRGIFYTTIWISAVCTISALILGFPIAYFLAKTQSKWKSIFIIFLVFPLLVGNVVRAAGWQIILDSNGVINSLLLYFGVIENSVRLLYTPFAVIIGTIAIIMPYLVLTLQSVLEGIDYSIEDAAQNLGASFYTTFRRIILPIAAPGIAAGTMLVFILCMNAYATPRLLGGTGVSMMAPTVYGQISHAQNWPFGAAIALVLVGTTLVLALISSGLIHRRYVKTMQAS